jgi:type I restriction enzyme M protein
LEGGNRPSGGVRQYKNGAMSLGGEHIGLDGNINLSKLKYVPNEYYNNFKYGIVKPEDIFVCKNGALTGKVAFVPKEIQYHWSSLGRVKFI